MKTWLIRIALTVIGFLLVMKATAADGHLAGIVVDRAGRAVPGVSVVVMRGDQVVTGRATAADGSFDMVVPVGDEDVLLSVSAVGFETKKLEVSPQDLSTIMTVRLNPTAHPVEAIRVAATPEDDPGSVSIAAEELSQVAAQSPVSSNPTSAIVAPSVTRAGSAHSSKLRIHGTSPDYFINGINVGRDPNHFGAFSIIPASVVDDIRLQPRGTGAEHSLPAIVSLRTPEPFNQTLKGSYSFSLIETNGSLALGNEKFFAIGSLRKSVLDKLVHYLDLRSDRRTIPPTNFEDIFVSTGWRPSDRTRLIIDQYHVRDYLSFQLDGSARNSDGITVAQHAGEHLVAARFEYLGDRVMHSLTAAVRDGVEKYHANPVHTGAAASINDFSLRLEENATLAQIDYRGSMISGQNTWTAGIQSSHTIHRDYRLKQANWNFTPPDAVSDVPFVYQEELNSLYSSAEGSLTGHDVAVFVTRRHDGERVSREVGLRLERFDGLSETMAATFRGRLNITIDDRSSLELFAGTFASSPMDRILQPYQMLVRDQLSELTPVRSRLVSAQLNRGTIRVGCFAKEIKGLPVAGADLTAVDESGAVQEGFIRMSSEGRGRFVGADITFDRSGLLSGNLDLYAFYNYVHAVQQTEGIETPYDLSAPHRLVVQSVYRFGRRLQVGVNLAVRSGNAYTSYAVLDALQGEERYSEDYYREYLAGENSERFPTNVSLDLHASYRFGGSQIFFNVANATNHANAIVNASDGYVYDSGILPSIGYRLEF